MKDKKYIRTLTTAGVSVFLITGLSGCNSESDCIKNAAYAPSPQKALEECKQSNYGNSSHYGSTFIPVNSTRSGFFSSSSSSSSHGS